MKGQKLVFCLALCVASVAAAKLPTLRSDNGLGRLPPLGWSTWCTQGPCARDYCDEGEIRSVADTLVSSGLSALGYTLVSLDDCWGGQRAADGSYQPDATRFPSGMKALADYVHSKGLTLGVYTDMGLYTCSQGERPYKIPGSYGHYQQDATTFASWGIDFVKADWCNTQVNGTQLDPRVQYPQLSKALNATGRPIFFAACEWGNEDPWTWASPWTNSWRATGDHHDNWKSTSGIIEQAAGLSKYAGPGGWNDLDFVFTGGEGCGTQIGPHCPGQTDVEYRTEYSLWAMVNSPIVVATDIRNLTSIMKDVLFNTEIIGIHQDKLARAGDRVGYWHCSEPLMCQVWTKPLADGSQAVMLYNAGTITHSITLDFALIGWPNATISLRDVWAKNTLGTFTNTFTSTVVSHGCLVLKATKR